MMGEVSRRLNAERRDIDDSPVPPATLAALVARIADGTISNNAARQVFDALWAGRRRRRRRAHRGQGPAQMSDAGELERIVDEVIAANPKSVEEFRAGKDKAFNALVGQAMKASQGKANPAQVNELLRRSSAEPRPSATSGSPALRRSRARRRPPARRRAARRGDGPSEPGGAPAHSFFRRASSAS